METPVDSRYFAFGCSYTNYLWPTYADYLGTCYDRYYNLGASGAGNRYIFNKLLNLINNQDLLSHPLGEKDVITIQWSGIPREDKILPEGNSTQFALAGHLGSQGTYPEEYVRTYFSLIQSAFELSAYITAVKNILENLGVQYKMFFMMEIKESDFLGEVFLTPGQTHQKLFEKDTQALMDCNLLQYIDSLLPEDIFSVEKHRLLHSIDKEKKYFIVHPNEEEGFELQEDTHPTPIAHYEYAKYLSNKISIGTMENLNIDYSETFSKFDKAYSKDNRKKVSNFHSFDNNEFRSLFPTLKTGKTKYDTPVEFNSTCLQSLILHIQDKYSKKIKRL